MTAYILSVTSFRRAWTANHCDISRLFRSMRTLMPSQSVGTRRIFKRGTRVETKPSRNHNCDPYRNLSPGVVKKKSCDVTVTITAMVTGSNGKIIAGGRRETTLQCIFLYHIFFASSPKHMQAHQNSPSMRVQEGASTERRAIAE
jgi:hypothetical protein